MELFSLRKTLGDFFSNPFLSPVNYMDIHLNIFLSKKPRSIWAISSELDPCP